MVCSNRRKWWVRLQQSASSRMGPGKRELEWSVETKYGKPILVPRAARRHLPAVGPRYSALVRRAPSPCSQVLLGNTFSLSSASALARESEGARVHCQGNPIEAELRGMHSQAELGNESRPEDHRMWWRDYDNRFVTKATNSSSANRLAFTPLELLLFIALIRRLVALSCPSLR